mmetsp:Transcript_19390/g.36139  ORF Transcript_19390/g.36139 Transcript_19390/m.36139 type:complete len:203 (-) Transcript_19390:1866-2474(-)
MSGKSSLSSPSLLPRPPRVPSRAHHTAPATDTLHHRTVSTAHSTIGRVVIRTIIHGSIIIVLRGFVSHHVRGTQVVHSRAFLRGITARASFIPRVHPAEPQLVFISDLLGIAIAKTGAPLAAIWTGAPDPVHFAKTFSPLDAVLVTRLRGVVVRLVLCLVLIARAQSSHPYAYLLCAKGSALLRGSIFRYTTRGLVWMPGVH